MALVVISVSLGCDGSGQADAAISADATPSVVPTTSDAGGDAVVSDASADRTPRTVRTPVPSAKPRGNPAPNFTLAELEGRTVRLSDYRGDVVLLDFWATWCGPCRMSIPHLIELQNEYADDGFTVLGVSLDRAGRDVVSRFVEKAGINYPVVMGTGAVQEAYGGIRSIPTAFLIDRDGYVVKMIQGYQPKNALVTAITPLLAAPRPAPESTEATE